MKVDISWIDNSLLKVTSRNLIWATSLRSILIRDAMQVVRLILGIFGRPIVLWRVRWFGIRLIVVIVSAWTSLASSWGCSSLRMARLHVVLLLRLLNLKCVIVVLNRLLPRHLLNLTLICIAILIHYESSFVTFISLSHSSDLLSRPRSKLRLLLLLLLLLLQTIWLIDVNHIATCSNRLLAESFVFLKLSLVQHLTSQTLRSLHLLHLWLLLMWWALRRSNGGWTSCCCWLLMCSLRKTCRARLRLLLLTLSNIGLLLLIKIRLSQLLRVCMVRYVLLLYYLTLSIHLNCSLILFLALIIVHMLNLTVH